MNKETLRNSASPRRRKLGLWLIALLLLYTVVGFLILPPIVRLIAIKQLSEQLNRQVAIKKIKFNPYAISIAVDGLMIKDPDGTPFVCWDEVYVRFQLSSVFRHAWGFKEISLDRPYVHMQMNADRSFNFSDLLRKFSTNAAPVAAPAPKVSAPVALQIQQFNIRGAVAALADYTTRTPFKRTLGPIDITLDNFRTDPDNKNPYAFAGTTDDGAHISWHGFFYLSPLRSEGDLTLNNLTLNKYAPLYQDLVRFEIRDGVLGFHADYKFEFSATNHTASVSDAAVSLRDFKLGEPGNSNDIVELPFFSVAGAGVDAQGRRASVDSILLDGSRLDIRRNKDASINVVQLAQPPATPANLSGSILFLLRSVTNAVALLLNSTNQWAATVRAVDVTNAAVYFQDDVNSRPAKLALTGISFNAKNISNLPGTNFTSRLALRWNECGTITSETTASLTPPNFDVQLDLDQIDLGTLDPYLEPKLDIFILGSRLGLHGRILLQTPSNELPVVTFNGDASLDGFRTVDSLGDDLLKWDSVHVNGIRANLNPPTVKIRQIALNNLFANLVIETNHTINLMNVLRLTDTNAAAANKKPTQPVAAAAPTVTNSALPAIAIEEVMITNTTASFTDHSFSPAVHLDIEQVNGLLAGLSTEQLRHANLDLGAQVEGIGPARISGTLSPFNQSSTNEVKISLQGMDLTPASPYVVKYAGYELAEGKLDLDLEYQVVGRKLSSKNIITLDRFTFGQKVPGPDATHLPVRLAVALLKDSDGKIVLDVPVQGSLDDPKFRIGKVVMRVIVNILEKVATSPFSLLGAAFGGGGEELSYQDFAPGSAALLPDGEKKLDSLAKALNARPALELEINGSVIPDADRTGLRRAALDREIRTRLWQQLRDSERATNSADQLVLAPADRVEWTQKLFREAVTDGRITPAIIGANTNLASLVAAQTAAASRQGVFQKTDALLVQRNPLPSLPVGTSSAGATNSEAPPDPMTDALLALFPIGEADLATLAAARAQAVQDYLSQTGKVAATRLFLTAKASELNTNGTRAYLKFR
jgi:hypothetical protein